MEIKIVIEKLEKRNEEYLEPKIRELKSEIGEIASNAMSSILS